MKQDKNRGMDYGSGNSHANGPSRILSWRLFEAKQIIQSTFWDFLE